MSRRTLAARENGRKGGLATARIQDEEFLEQRSTAGGNAIKDRYGSEYYSYIRTLRSKPKTTKEKIQDVIKSVIPVKEVPTNTIELMQMAGKTLA